MSTVERAGASGIVPLGVWTHLAVSWEGSADRYGVRHFVNGVEAPLRSPADIKALHDETVPPPGCRDGR